MRIGIDTGGTFTDFVSVYPNGRLDSFKLASNPADPASVIIAGIERIAGDVAADIVHGSTVATNALLERKGARTAFVTTAGFEDIFHIGRQNRRELYNLTPVTTVPLVQPDHCFGVAERTLFDGNILRKPEPAELQRLVRALQKAKIESIAICLLHSYQCPDNERTVQQALAEAGVVCVSADVSPEFREYERASTTVLNAYIGPVMQRYLASLESKTAKHSLSIMQSNGGSIRPDEAQRLAVRTLLSGPAGGAGGAAWVAAQSGFDKTLGFDMGGTSTDVCLIDGKPRETTEASVDGFPVRIPMFDIHTVGAGGGSIARVDEGGLLRVGPQSAGAVPGPACYGKGDLPTVTDAHVVLGRISADQLAGGSLTIDPKRSQKVLERLALQLKLSAVQAAEGVIRVANSNMERAIRAVSVERGHDPRGFALLAFGGGGGLHACEIAESLEMQSVLVPPLAGALSALGMLVADRIRDYSRGVLQSRDIETEFTALEKIAFQENPRARLTRTADVRYAGQSYELNIRWAGAKTAKLFHAAHQRNYGYSDGQRAVEIVTIRVRATEHLPKPKLSLTPTNKKLPGENRRLFVAGHWHKVPILTRETIGKRPAHGPALILDYGSTTLVPPKWTVRLDAVGSLLLRLS
jgi:N-methylhydantoinase A/oxoprolinase/acetone carboxylase beta subunit